MNLQVSIREFIKKKSSDWSSVSEGDMRRRFSRFNKEEFFKHNMNIVDAFRDIAEKKGVTPAQLSLAWVASLGPKVIPIPGSSCVSYI